MARVRFTYIYDELICVNCFKIRDIQFFTSSTYLGRLDRRGISQMGQNATNFEQPGRARSGLLWSDYIGFGSGPFQSFGLRLPHFQMAPKVSAKTGSSAADRVRREMRAFRN